MQHRDPHEGAVNSVSAFKCCCWEEKLCLRIMPGEMLA